MINPRPHPIAGAGLTLYMNGAGRLLSRPRRFREPKPAAECVRSVAQLARAPVSKTGGWGFESLLSCQQAGG